MNGVSFGVAFVLIVFSGSAVSDSYSRTDTSVRNRDAGQVLLAGSGDNPWALPDQRRGERRLPEYITNPKYATEEDRETKLNYGKKEQTNSGRPVQQPVPQGYGAPLGLPAVPNIYAPYSGAPYGYQPGYPVYPGMGTLPGMGAPYTGDTGFGGNPMVSPYGNIYGTGVPYQETQPSSDK